MAIDGKYGRVTTEFGQFGEDEPVVVFRASAAPKAVEPDPEPEEPTPVAPTEEPGRVTTEFGQFGEDEPVVVFRAKDRLLPKLLKVYRYFCELSGSPQFHLDLIDQTARKVKDWQAANPTKTPDSVAHQPRLEAENPLERLRAQSRARAPR